MRKANTLLLAVVLGIASALLGTATHAQQFPPNMAPNTVVGRLGSGLPGPAQAIPFSSFAPAITPFLNFNFAASTAVPGVNASTFNASGSSQQTTGTISSVTNTTRLTLAGALDFINGEGVIVNNAGATFATNPPTSLSISNQGTPGSTHRTYQIASLDANGGVGAAITGVTTTTSNATLGTSNFNRLTWSAPGSGPTPVGYAIYRDDGGGPFLLGFTWQNGTTYDDFGNGLDVGTGPFWIPSSPQGSALNDWLQTSIVSGGGTTTLTVANAATHTVSGATVMHDDSVAIQNAINALPVSGGTVNLVGLSGNNFNIATTVNIGNGTSTTYSTRYGVKLVGVGIPEGTLQQAAPLPTPNGTVWNETGPNGYLNIAGPLLGWGVEDIFFSCNDLQIGLQVVNAGDGDSRNLSFSNCLFAGLDSTAHPSSGYGAPGGLDSVHNQYTHISVVVPQIGHNVDAIQIGGASDGSRDTDYNVFRDILVVNPGGVGQAQCLDLQVSDSNYFINVHCITNSVSGVLFNYNVRASFGGGNSFFGLDSPFVGNSGTQSGAAANKIYGFTNANSNGCPVNVAGVMCEGQQWISTAGCSNSGGVLTACTTTVTWPTDFGDTNYFPFCNLVNVTASHPMIVGSMSLTSSQMVVQQFSTVSGATSGTLVCHAFHQ